MTTRVELMMVDDSVTPERIILRRTIQKRQLSKTNVIRVFNLADDADIYLQNRYDNGVFLFEADGSMGDEAFESLRGEIESESYAPVFIVRVRTPSSMAGGRARGGSDRVFQFNPEGLYDLSLEKSQSQCTGGSSCIPQRFHRRSTPSSTTIGSTTASSITIGSNGSASSRMGNIRVTAVVGAWARDFSTYNPTVYTVTALVTENSSTLGQVIDRLVENGKGNGVIPNNYVLPNNEKVVYCLANKLGLLPANGDYDLEFWRGAQRYGSRLTLLPQPPSCVPKPKAFAPPTLITKRQKRKIELDEFKETMNLVMAKISSFESHDTSMTEIDSARGTATVPTPLRHHQVGQTGDGELRRIAVDFQCKVCLDVAKAIVICVSCNSPAGCETCINKCLEVNGRMPCCRGTERLGSFGGKKYLRLSGFDTTLTELNKWMESNGAVASTSSGNVGTSDGASAQTVSDNEDGIVDLAGDEEEY